MSHALIAAAACTASRAVAASSGESCRLCTLIGCRLGTEAETKEFMSVCIQTVGKYSPADLRSPVFIFERLCSIIKPEEGEATEFSLILEKDPQQEDFLQVWAKQWFNYYSSCYSEYLVAIRLLLMG